MQTPVLTAGHRNNQWLSERLQWLHAAYFPDVAIENKVVVKFGRQSKTRFGSIIARKEPGEALPVTYITINALFREQEIPDFVIDATLVHEFIHYTHGFHSPRRQMHRHPHKGGVVTKEMAARGAHHLYKQQRKWIKEEYKQLLQRANLLDSGPTFH
jgi:hypothetical protein